MARDSLRRLAASASNLISLTLVERGLSVRRLTVKLTVKTRRLVISSNDDNGLETQEVIEWE